MRCVLGLGILIAFACTPCRATEQQAVDLLEKKLVITEPEPQTALVYVGSPYRTNALVPLSSKELRRARLDAVDGILQLRNYERAASYLLRNAAFNNRAIKSGLKMIAFYPAAIALAIYGGAPHFISTALFGALGLSMWRFTKHVDRATEPPDYSGSKEAQIIVQLVERLVSRGFLTQKTATKLLASENPHALSEYLVKKFQIPMAPERSFERCKKILKLLP